MTTTVPLTALATSVEDIDAPLTRRFLFQKEDVRIHRELEYLWGLEIYTIDPTHERSILHIRKSTEVSLISRAGGWTLVPTEETLAAMLALQKYNITAPVSKRKSFLTEFSATEYEYIIVPLSTELDFFILQPGEAPRRFSSPYTGLPRVTSSAHPFFVAFDSRMKIERFGVHISKTWNWVFTRLTLHWFPSANLPEDFLRSCYPETLYTLSEHDSDPESGSDETVVTPREEDDLFHFPPDKEEFVSDWVRWDANHSHECGVPTAPTVSRDQGTKLLRTLKGGARWHVESTRGKKRFKELLEKMQSSPPATVS
ncbi:hypothetical protein DFH08DRAFT_845437 [Mycena albidolilacea]|uniref:Uncharacterized protein n=1 Tax=Mycena albidolilacea TaxID=1033008 RepID=A0AAD7F133_9AGAR|nr:hypothetical protein DFH08DRAFT_845437 [Mycena albidolilacea]